MQSVISCRNLTKAYRGQPVLDAFSLEIGAGICGLIGPNGAGKSTLLKMLTGLVAPDTGQVSIGERDQALQPIPFRRGIGVVPDDLGLFEDLTVLEHLRLIGPIYALSREQTEERATQLLRLLMLDHAVHVRARECSFGMRKKLALALALLHRPGVLILDEPFEGLDAASVSVLEQVLVSFAQAGGTVLLTSHLFALLERLARRIVLLHHGRVAWDSADAPLAATLEQTYFDLIGRPALELPSWS